jgi:hypothetical protein
MFENGFETGRIIKNGNRKAERAGAGVKEEHDGA